MHEIKPLRVKHIRELINNEHLVGALVGLYNELSESEAPNLSAIITAAATDLMSIFEQLIQMSIDEDINIDDLTVAELTHYLTQIYELNKEFLEHFFTILNNLMTGVIMAATSMEQQLMILQNLSNASELTSSPESDTEKD